MRLESESRKTSSHRRSRHIGSADGSHRNKRTTGAAPGFLGSRMRNLSPVEEMMTKQSFTPVRVGRYQTRLGRAARALVACLAFAAAQPGASSPASASSRFDGQWNLVFVTQRGDCDSSYNFTVDVVNGNISHPNILTFRGRVAPSGAVRASVRVGQKYASGSGKLSGVIGRGVWSGSSGQSRCAGTWAAQRN
jgi:hypothetical protein